MPVYEIKEFRGALSDYNDRGISGAFKFGANLDVRKQSDTLSCQQALVDEGIITSQSPSASASPSSSISFSPSLSSSPSSSASTTPSPSPSSSPSPSTGTSDSPSRSASLSPSPSASVSPSSSVSLSPSASGGLTTVFRDLIRFFVEASDGYTYGFGNTGYIYRRNSDAFWQVVYKDPDGAIKGAIEKPSSTTTYLAWATDTKIKTKDISGLSNWNDVTVLAQNLNSTDWHTMVQVGGAALIANGSWIAQLGYDDSWTNEALDLIPGNTAKTMIERNGRLITGTHKTGFPTKGINAAIDSEVPLVQYGDDGDIFYANMSDTVPVKRLPGGGKCNPGGVCNEIEPATFFEWDAQSLSWIDKQAIGNMALLAVYDADSGKGGIYKYGRKNKNHPFVLNLDHQFDADELGAIASVDGTVIVSYQDGSDFGVKAVDQTAKATAIYEGLEFKSPLKKPVNATVWKYVEIIGDPLPDGSSVEFWYKLNKDGGFIRAKMEGDSSTFQARDEVQAVFYMGDNAQVFEPKLILNPTGNTSPEISKIRIHFE